MHGQGRAENTTAVHNRVEERKGRAKRRAWQEGKTELKARVRAGNGMSGQGRAGQHMAGQGTAGEWHGRRRGRSTFRAGQGRVVTGAGAGAVAVAGAGA